MVGGTLPGSGRDVWTGEVGSLQWASWQALRAPQRARGGLIAVIVWWPRAWHRYGDQCRAGAALGLDGATSDLSPCRRGRRYRSLPRPIRRADGRLVEDLGQAPSCT